MQNQLNNVGELKQAITALALQFGPKVLVAVAFMIGGVLAARWVGRWSHRSLSRFGLEPPAHRLLVGIVWCVVFGLFVLMALQNLGVQLLPLVAGLGVVGAGIALATQGILSDILAGLTIIFTKPFRVGDYVALPGGEGQVQAITLSSTTLCHPDLSRVVIPNRKFVGEILHNYGKVRQLEISANVARDTDLDLAIAAIEAVIGNNPRCLRDPAPPVGVSGVADGAICITARPWVSVDDYAVAAAEVKKAVIEAFRAKAIAGAIPMRTVEMAGKLRLGRRRKAQITPADILRGADLVLKDAMPPLSPSVPLSKEAH